VTVWVVADWAVMTSRGIAGVGASRLVPAVVGLVLAAIAVPLFYPYLAPTDAYVYLAAGERLNAGHDLYALMPGDRIIPTNPPYWTVPTLSPPLLAVLWRPLAVLGDGGMLLGWALAGTAYLGAIAALAYRVRGLAVAALAVVVAPVGIQLGLGNVNGLLAIGLVALWLGRGRPWVAGAVLALMVGVKVTPVVLVLWLLATGRHRAVGAFLVASLGLLAVSVVGAGWDAHVDYLGVMAQTMGSGSSDWSLPGLGRRLGIPGEVARWLPWLALAVAGVAMLRWPRHSFGLAVMAMVFGSPVVQPYWFGLLPIGLLSARDVTAE
jgi:alpha-1,2-mannosyltransferase